MASFNQVTLLGNLTRDVETRDVGSSSVAHFTLAVSEKYKTKSGEQREETAFVDVEFWGRSAEIAAEYLSKGSAVLVSGKLSQDNWEDKQTGAKRSKLKVKGNPMGGLTLLPSGGGGQRAPQNESRQQQPSNQGSVPDDEVPF